MLLSGAVLLSGCETVAVVDRSPYYRPGAVYYESGRPYYYTSGVRHWGYPHGYRGRRVSYTHVDRDVEINRNYYVDRRRVSRGDRDRRRPTVTNVKVQPQKKKKVVRGSGRDRDRD